MTKSQDYKGNIRTKKLGGTNVTDDQLRLLYGRKGKFHMGIVELEVEETHENKAGVRKVDLIVNRVQIVTDSDALEAHLRQLDRTLHQNQVLNSDDAQLQIDTQGDVEPSVDAVIAAQRAHAAGEPHVFDPAEDGDDCVVCGEDLENELHAGEWVESDTAVTGAAINAETGEVTAPGEPLPTIDQEDGEPLDPTGEDDSAH